MSAVSGHQSSQSSVAKIPVRATIFSAVSTLPYLIGPLIAGPDREVYPEKAIAVKIALSIFLALRCPLTALITYASSKKTNES